MITNECDWSKLPPHLGLKIKGYMENNPNYVALVKKHKEALSKRDYILAVEIKKQIQRVEQSVLKSALAMQEDKIAIMDLFKTMPKTDVTKVRVLLEAIAFMCDALEDYIFDTEQLIKKYHPDTYLAFYNKLRRAMSELQQHTNLALGKDLDEQSQLWLDTSEQITKYIKGKVSTFVKERDKLQKK